MGPLDDRNRTPSGFPSITGTTFTFTRYPTQETDVPPRHEALGANNEDDRAEVVPGTSKEPADANDPFPTHTPRIQPSSSTSSPSRRAC